MAWQEIAALFIVGFTALAFAWGLLRPRGLGRKKGLACSCSGAGNARSMPNMVFKARKGERAQILVKAPAP